MKGKCRKCHKRKKLTKHSLVGSHLPPYIYLCEKCHQKIHKNIKKNKIRYDKIQKGSPYRKRKLKVLKGGKEQMTKITTEQRKKTQEQEDWQGSSQP